MTPTHSSPPSDFASPACPDCADLTHEVVLERGRVAAAGRQMAHIVATSRMREAVLAEALLAAPDAALEARAHADAQMLQRIRATWWYRLFGGRMERRNTP